MLNRPLVLALVLSSFAYSSNPDLLTKGWSANWITVPGAPAHDFGVYHFRKSFDLASKPARFLVHVSADNRYQLFVNGQRVAWGPARGDVYHWRYETVDIAPFLRAGKNLAAAVVWNFGEDAPQAQQTIETGFVLQGDTAAERVADTNKSWKCVRDEAYEPIPFSSGQMRGYYVAGPGEKLVAAKYPWGWEHSEFNDSGWQPAKQLGTASARDARDSHSPWLLVPRSIPMMEEKPEAAPKVRESNGPAGAGTIPANTKVRMLLDQTYLTTGYPELRLSGGSGATVKLGYAESLFLANGRGKGNRNEIEGKQFVGNYDVFVADGGRNRTFRPLWWRTWRYMELTVETKNEPLVIEGISATYTGYPFERKARFDAHSKEIETIMDTGWRTARLCAHESYMDCPYYEQLQYAGDTRIQALVSMYMTGDGRLARNAIEQLNASRTSEGATMSRAPTRLHQYIPGFSLWWIGMLHDYWMYQDDPKFVKEMLPGVRAVLSFFAARQRENGSLGPMPWWNYVDWTKEWKSGVPGDGQSGTAPADLQLLLAYQWAASMEESMGSKSLAGEYRESAKKLAAAIQKLYWDAGRRMYADDAGKTAFSQHASSLAVLAGLVPANESRELIGRVAADASLVQCSIYFRYYLHAAFNKSGGGDAYLDQLGQWRAMLGYGLSTWAEVLDPTRSDCHAWGASPNFELFRTVLGIDSAAPGFRRVVIRPYLGKLTKVSGSIPHPQGDLAVSLTLSGGHLEAEVTLPGAVDGEFVWKGQRRALKPGANRLKF
jgi:hypothetical protein